MRFIPTIFATTLFLAAMPLEAFGPVSSTIALVAGEGAAGFRDGDFTAALFNQPMGLSASPDGSRLFVADSENNRIRIIHLDNNNNVTTLAGGNTPGNRNGTLEQARFNKPHQVVYLPGERLIVNDFGNKVLRLIDLNKNALSTLAGDAPTTLSEGPAARISMAGIRDITYLPGADSLFFSQPDQMTLKRLDLKTNQVTLVPSNPELACPGALSSCGSRLYIADLKSTKVFVLDYQAGSTPSLLPIADATSNVLALAASETRIYALQTGSQAPLQSLWPENHPVTFVSAWGDVITDPGVNLPSVLNLHMAGPPGLIPDPMDGQKLYIVNTAYNIITSFRDGPAPVPHKPSNTFRILLVGDSRSSLIVPYRFRPMPYDPYSPPRQLSIADRMSLALNTLASLDNEHTRFEVLNYYQSASIPLFLWPTYDVPEEVRRNDIDLVVILQPTTPRDFFPFDVYFTHPMTKEGIPTRNIDPEYLLKPPQERIPAGEPRRFFDLCKARKFVRIEGKSIVFTDGLKRDQYGYNIAEETDPELFNSIVQLTGKPLGLLSEKLLGMRTSADKPVGLLLCPIKTGSFHSAPDDPRIWERISQRFHVPFMDLSGEMTALCLSYYPLAEPDGNQHFDINGHLFFAELLAHDLIHGGFIPWAGNAPASGNASR